MRIAAELHLQSGPGRSGQVGRHRVRRAAKERKRRHEHPPVANRNQVGQAGSGLLLEQLDHLAAVRRRLPFAMCGARHLGASRLAVRRPLLGREVDYRFRLGWGLGGHLRPIEPMSGLKSHRPNGMRSARLRNRPSGCHGRTDREDADGPGRRHTVGLGCPDLPAGAPGKRAVQLKREIVVGGRRTRVPATPNRHLAGRAAHGDRLGIDVRVAARDRADDLVGAQAGCTGGTGRAGAGRTGGTGGAGARRTGRAGGTGSPGRTCGAGGAARAKRAGGADRDPRGRPDQRDRPDRAPVRPMGPRAEVRRGRRDQPGPRTSRAWRAGGAGSPGRACGAGGPAGPSGPGGPTGPAGPRGPSRPARPGRPRGPAGPRSLPPDPRGPSLPAVLQGLARRRRPRGPPVQAGPGGRARGPTAAPSGLSCALWPRRAGPPRRSGWHGPARSRAMKFRRRSPARRPTRRRPPRRPSPRVVGPPFPELSGRAPAPLIPLGERHRRQAYDSGGGLDGGGRAVAATSRAPPGSPGPRAPTS